MLNTFILRLLSLIPPQMIAKGKDCSNLFPAVVKNVVSKNSEVRQIPQSHKRAPLPPSQLAHYPVYSRSLLKQLPTNLMRWWQASICVR